MTICSYFDIKKEGGICLARIYATRTGTRIGRARGGKARSHSVRRVPYIPVGMAWEKELPVIV